MRFLSLAFLSLVVSNAAALLSVERFDGKITGRYIVKFKSGVPRQVWTKKLNTLQRSDWENINGFASHLKDEDVEVLRASPDVEYIGEDGVINYDITQNDATWGLSRLSSSRPPADADSQARFPFTYEESAAGRGVDIYVLDSGIYLEHQDFGGRARWGTSVGNLPRVDDHGHGTHCAGSAAGTRYGVAKQANLIAVKVGSTGGSTVEWLISGLDWVLTQAQRSGKPSVASISLSGGNNTAVDQAVAKLVASGVHVVVSAGNIRFDADYLSPAREPTVLTVGASNYTDVMASFSNYGSVLDIYAPGVDVLSADIAGPSSTKVRSGTSMAAPHVAGLVAYLISRDGNISPAAMSDKLKATALKGIIGDIPDGTINALAHIV